MSDQFQLNYDWTFASAYAAAANSPPPRCASPIAPHEIEPIASSTAYRTPRAPSSRGDNATILVEGTTQGDKQASRSLSQRYAKSFHLLYRLKSKFKPRSNDSIVSSMRGDFLRFRNRSPRLWRPRRL